MIYFYKSGDCVFQTAMAKIIVFCIAFEWPIPAHICAHWSNIACLPAGRIDTHSDIQWKLKMLSQTVRIAQIVVGCFLCYDIDFIPAKPLHSSDIVSMHFNHFYCMGICDKLTRHLFMLTYIYLNMDECWLTSSVP